MGFKDKLKDIKEALGSKHCRHFSALGIGKCDKLERVLSMEEISKWGCAADKGAKCTLRSKKKKN